MASQVCEAWESGEKKPTGDFWAKRPIARVVTEWRSEPFLRAKVRVRVWAGEGDSVQQLAGSPVLKHQPPNCLMK